jgi:ABC-2 type transport system permease protein
MLHTQREPQEGELTMPRPPLPTGFPALAAVVSGTSTGALRGRRLLAMLILLGLPLVIQIGVLLWGAERGTGFAHFVDLLDKVYLRIILPLALIFLGTAAFGDEWEGGTACYVVGLPMPRTTLVLGRWLACLLRALLLALPALLVLYVLCLVRHEGALLHYLPDLGLVLVGFVLVMAGYTAVFVFLGLALRRSVMTALGYVLLFEGFISSMPLGFSIISLSFHSRNLIWHMTGHEGFMPIMHSFEDVEPTGPLTSLAWLIGYQVVFLALAARTLRRKEFTGGTETTSS